MSKDKVTTSTDPADSSHSERKTVTASLAEKQPSEPASCGVVMPISSIDGCSAEHWSEVKVIIFETVKAIANPIFSVRLVSDDEASGVIQKRIVQNIYNCDIVICDVSAKNPNVMFELGMRLAFDKPTIIIKDDKTDYSFDTAIIEHIPYPRDLRFNKIVNFKNYLTDKIVATYESAKSNSDHSTFLKNFGTFHIAKISETVLPAEKILLNTLQDLQEQISSLRMAIQQNGLLSENLNRHQHNFLSEKLTKEMRMLGTARIKQVIEETLRTNSKHDPTRLKDNEHFADYLINNEKLGVYFQSKDEVIECVNQLLIARTTQIA